jgi:hypothetical protein
MAFEFGHTRDLIFLVKADNVNDGVGTHSLRAVFQGDQSPQERPIAADLGVAA